LFRLLGTFEEENHSMKSRTSNRYFSLPVVLAIFALTAGSALAQRERIPADGLHIQPACPKPVVMTLTAGAPTVVNADFNAIQLGAPRAALNETNINRSFLYTFEWKRDERCCEITKAVLTVKMKSLGPGASKTASDAGNDGIAIMHNGSTVAPFTEPVYGSWPFPVGQLATKQWNLTGAALANLNANRRLSIYVQDDTSVLSATLQLWGCCLTPQGTKVDSANYVGK
jgi:hypothetical protein